MSGQIKTIDDYDYHNKTVLLRVDINSPIDQKTGKIANENRLDKSLSTIGDLSNKGAKLVIMAHQGDTLDYHNLVSLAEHAEKLTLKLGKPVQFIDDVAGPAAKEKITLLKAGEILLLDNIRIYTEEVSTFENDVKLTAQEMTQTYMVQNLAPLIDFYVNDAFAAAHRNAPSMVAFQQILPSSGGRLLINELAALSTIMDHPQRPCVFILGGLKISDAFGMMKQVLEKGVADTILTTGVTGQIFLMAQKIQLGEASEEFIYDRSLDKFISQARTYLEAYSDKIHFPQDVAVRIEENRKEIMIEQLPSHGMIVDIGEKTIVNYENIISKAGTLFVNGPAGVYEKRISAKGTKRLWNALAKARGFTVIGGGDTVASANHFIDTDQLDFISTGGGALVRHISGVQLPLIEAMKNC